MLLEKIFKNFFVLSFVLDGIGQGFFMPTSNAIIGELFDGNTRGAFMGVKNGVSAFMRSGLTLLAGFLGVAYWYKAYYIFVIMIPLIALFMWKTPSGEVGEKVVGKGAGESIGKGVTKLLGKDKAPYIIMLASFIVSLSGMNSSMFAIAALSHVVMKEANLPSYIGMVSFLGMKELTSFAMPGLAHSGNLLPATYLGTDLYAGAVPGLIAMFFGWTLIIIYVSRLVKDARKNNKGYENFFAEKQVENAASETPSFITAVIPFSCVPVLTFILQKVFLIKASVAAFATQTFAIVLMVISCRKYFRLKIGAALTAGAKRGGEFLVSASCLVGFASVVADTPVFEDIQFFWHR